MWWAGVDVGGRQKGFHVAVIEFSTRGLRLALHAQIAGSDAADAVTSLLEHFSPKVIAVDSPRAPASTGAKLRPCEHALNKAIGCGIRGTPDKGTIATRSDDLYEWIQEGWKLYTALEKQPNWTVIECFPTATWARLDKVRCSVSRAKWSEDILTRELGRPGLLKHLPQKRNQDVRDAIAAAYTARLSSQPGKTETFTCPGCPRLPQCGIVVVR